jgi:hypothetical protein
LNKFDFSNSGMYRIICILSSVLLFIMQVSCVSVKKYQRAYLNDAEMQLGDRKISVFEADFHAYREGAVGGTIGNSGSGCGCN